MRHSTTHLSKQSRNEVDVRSSQESSSCPPTRASVAVLRSCYCSVKFVYASIPTNKPKSAMPFCTRSRFSWKSYGPFPTRSTVASHTYCRNSLSDFRSEWLKSRDACRLQGVEDAAYHVLKKFVLVCLRRKYDAENSSPHDRRSLLLPHRL